MRDPDGIKMTANTLAQVLIFATIIAVFVLLMSLIVSPACSQSGYCSTICDTSGKNAPHRALQ